MQQEQALPVVLEVHRLGRRPRYHRGVRLPNGVLLKPEQCNLDQIALVFTELEALPESIRRPWAQLCRRCWHGSATLEAAVALQAATP